MIGKVHYSYEPAKGPKEKEKVTTMNKYRVIMSSEDADHVSVINMNDGIPAFCDGNLGPWQNGRSERSLTTGMIICDVEANVVEVAVKRARRMAVVFLEQRYHVTFSLCENVGGYDCYAKSSEEAIDKARISFGPPDWRKYGGDRAFAFDVDAKYPVSESAREVWREGRKIQRQIT